jgi:hypothetical protein
MMIARIIQLALVVALVAPGLAAQERSKAEDVVVTGEVIDTKCYISGSMGNGRGENHRDCALMCAKAGVPLGILADGTDIVYFAAKLKGIAGANEMLIPFVADRVSVKGKLVQKGGARVLLIDTVEKLK